MKRTYRVQSFASNGEAGAWLTEMARENDQLTVHAVTEAVRPGDDGGWASWVTLCVSYVAAEDAR
jgi:hypothetical protein